MKGMCKKGDSCDFYHPPDCENHKRGKCTKGDNCKYRHLDGAAAASSSSGASTPRSDKKKKGKKNQKKKKKDDQVKTEPVANLATTVDNVANLAAAFVCTVSSPLVGLSVLST